MNARDAPRERDQQAADAAADLEGRSFGPKVDPVEDEVREVPLPRLEECFLGPRVAGRNVESVVLAGPAISVLAHGARERNGRRGSGSAVREVHEGK